MKIVTGSRNNQLNIPEYKAEYSRSVRAIVSLAEETFLMQLYKTFDAHQTGLGPHYKAVIVLIPFHSFPWRRLNVSRKNKSRSVPSFAN